ncbi:cation-translocating P-type ATPase [Halomonas sp. Bachu 37]|uniref:heavy metal translocating P-type ATPase n=1 Tax=Halomonas kashgarensis TaxID=3084920 RepID=UPI0032169975
MTSFGSDQAPHAEKSASAGEAGHAEALFSLEGMWCSSCALAVEACLQRLPGIREASVHYPSASLLVSGAASTLSLETLAPVVSRLGYRLTPPESTLDAHGRLERESRYLALRLLVATVFGMWTMLASLLIYVGALPTSSLELVLAWVSAAFSVPVVGYAGLPFYRAGWRTLRAGRPGMDVLISLGVLGAVAVSLWLLSQGIADVYFDTAVMLIVLLLVGRLVDTLCRHRGLRALDALNIPNGPLERLEAGHWQACALPQVEPGDVVKIEAEGHLSVDGIIRHVPVWIDTAPMTGESTPRRMLPGDKVHAGCRNVGPAFELEVSAGVGGRRLDAMREQMWRYQARKGELQRLADRFAAWLSPLALGLAGVTLVLALLTGVALDEALVRALSVLVVACPCAVGLAVPLASLAGSSRALARGVVFRDPAVFETLAMTRAVAFDKTGTLTPGEPQLREYRHADSIPIDEVACLTNRATRDSEHPLSRAIRRWAHDQAFSSSSQDAPPLESKEQPGEGRWVAFEDGTVLHLGRREWLESLGAELPVSVHGVSNQAAASEVLLCRDLRWVATFTLGESACVDAVPALQTLRDQGMVLALISGDRAGPVHELGRSVGLSSRECFPGRSPEAKARLLQALPGPVLYVGDGINDALALASAGVGMAPEGASSAARESAAIQLLNPGITGVVEALDIARRTRRVMRQNLVLSAIYNTLALGLAVTMAIPPLVAVAAMAASSLSVMGNAARLAWSGNEPTGVDGSRRD